MASTTVWLSYEEERSAASHGPRGTYHHNFYLVDNHGKKLLAATGVDQGDAHYQYTSSSQVEGKGIAHYECRNREHLKEWLQGLITQSQRAANFQVAQAHDEEHLTEIRALPCPKHHPAFTGWRQEKFTNGDAPKVIKWWLLDVHGHEHLAVVGEEKENKDGHYAYLSQEPFQTTHPLNVGSQAKVLAWIEQMLHLHSPESGAEGVTPGSSAATAPPPELVSNNGTRGWQRPSFFLRPGSGGILGAVGLATPGSMGKRVSAKRQKVGEGKSAPAAAPLEDARGMIDLLSRWAVCERAQRKAGVEVAVKWIEDDIDADMTTALMHYADRARALLAEGSAAKRAAAAAPGNDLTLECIEVLQELGTTRLPAVALHSSGLVPLMQQLAKHKNVVVSSMASDVLRRWTALAARHVRVLANAQFDEDPCEKLVQLLTPAAPPPAPGPTAPSANAASGAPGSAAQSPSTGTLHPAKTGHVPGFDAQLGEPDVGVGEEVNPVLRSPRSARSPMFSPKLPWPTTL